jgi:metal-responsive CopG/Arc/MetJ family transcriptional regulator
MEMEGISIKLEKDFLAVIEKVMKKNNYATKTEFIREAIRDKVEGLEEKEEMRRQIARLAGSSKRKTTDEDLHKAGEIAFERLEKKFRKK